VHGAISLTAWLRLPPCTKNLYCIAFAIVPITRLRSPIPVFLVAEYLETESKSELCHEYLDGQIFAIAAGKQGRYAAQVARSMSAFTLQFKIKPEEKQSMSLTFYFAPMSTASITEAVLAELAIPFDLVKLNISVGDTKKPEFLKVNPNGRVPAIVHEGTAIWESSAITMYLGEVFGVDAKLYPAPGPKRGEAMKWIVWSSVTLAEAASRLFASLPPEKQGDVETNSQEKVAPEMKSAIAMEKAKADLADCLRILNGGLEGRSFLIGDYSLADTHLHSMVGWISSMEVDLTPFPNVTGWLKRCYDRPAIAQSQN
jgi:glutathione S-transferase